MASTALRLASKAVRDPRRAVLRLVLRSRLGRLHMDDERTRLISFLSRHFHVDASAFLEEYRRSAFRRWFQDQRAALARFPGPYRMGTTGEFGCEAMYLLIRAARPRRVVETGVLYGGSSAHVLAAMAMNGEGELHSIDIGRDEREPPHDFFIPVDLRSSWDLVIGDSRRVLSSVLSRCGTIDMFHHDSLHTSEHMTWEFATALPYIKEGGILSSDDVLNPPSLTGIFRANPFHAFCASRGLSFSTFQNLGIALRASTSAPPSMRQGAHPVAHGRADESWKT
jgi:predicted O-methyltransferase YrrM